MSALPGPVTSLSGLDLILMAVLGLSAVQGLRRGFVAVVLGYAGYLGALVIAGRYSRVVAAWLQARFGVLSSLERAMAGWLGAEGIEPGRGLAAALAQNLLSAVVFFGLFLLLSSLAGMLANRLGGLANAMPLVGPANRIMGAVLAGVVSGIFLAAGLGVLSSLTALPFLEPLGRVVATSRVAGFLLRVYGLVSSLLFGRTSPFTDPFV
ncbi:CvpA family protein [Caldinitratiruptor microaerophilus]|uniref:Colicin V production protein n=1 Tax=Caldinitratiruptor microaerophilus TaxID=671077 RepID=A0AA35G973_9FIRM|nr:CvpA family protein [Caldinitratiruptor microaerophilus]BDG61850.1 hypothetical protein caldi_29400 [Caldinitratiruptor microaerophilus]